MTVNLYDGSASVLNTVKIGLLGLGTVGQAVVALNQPFQDTHFEIVGAVVRDINRSRQVQVPLANDPRKLLRDPAVDIVVEVMGGRQPARQWIQEALSAGKSVVTANKELMAYDGAELLHHAARQGQALAYEASVGGGIPILDALGWHLSSAPLHRITGVLNGTSNYLISQMEAGMDYDLAIREAQTQGYAEADPSADVDGNDAVRKLVLLAELGFGSWLNPDTISRRSLNTTHASDFSRLAGLGFGIRAVAMLEKTNTSLKALVAPVAFPQSHRMMTLHQAQNGVEIQSQAGTFWLEGPGAGGLATATSIWADIRRLLHRKVASYRASPSGTADPLLLPWLLFTTDPDRQLPSPGVDSPILVLDATAAIYRERPTRLSDGIRAVPVVAPI